MKDKNRYVKTGIMVFTVIAASISFFFILFYSKAIVGFFKDLMRILTPVNIGFVIAYLVNPVVNTIEARLLRIFGHFKIRTKTRRKLSKGIAITLALLLFIAVITVLLRFVIPEVYESAMTLVNNLRAYINSFYAYVNGIFEGNPAIQEKVQDVLNSLTNYVYSLIDGEFVGNVTAAMGKITTGLFGAAKMLVNVFLGFCVAIYLLVSKSTFVGQVKKMLYAHMKRERVNVLLAVLRQVDSIFGGFISGKLVDSLIIGIICFIGVSILRMPYAILIAVVIGVTNIIPIFGPWIGAVPCSLIVLIADPPKAIVFIIFILLLQQFDGNILGPMILGDSTGLSAFWVVVAITLGGGLFGLPGMILGVPTLATIYFLFKTYTEFKLKERNMPIQSVSYTRIKRIDPETNAAEFMDYSMTKRERKKQGILEAEVSEEIENAARLSRKNKMKAEEERRKVFEAKTEQDGKDKEADKQADK